MRGVVIQVARIKTNNYSLKNSHVVRVIASNTSIKDISKTNWVDYIQYNSILLITTNYARYLPSQNQNFTTIFPINVSLEHIPILKPNLTSSKIRPTTRRLLPNLLQQPPMLLNSIATRLLRLSLTQRIRVPSFEAVFLVCGWIAYTLCTMGLEDCVF